jgi:hypothetical protein
VFGVSHSPSVDGVDVRTFRQFYPTDTPFRVLPAWIASTRELYTVTLGSHAGEVWVDVDVKKPAKYKSMMKLLRNGVEETGKKRKYIEFE